MKRSLIFFVCNLVLLTSCEKLQNKPSPDSMVEIYYDCLQQWAPEQAFNFLSDKLKAKTTKYSYRPQSCFGEWYRTSAFTMNYVIFPDQLKKNTRGKVLVLLFDAVTGSQKKLICEVVIEQNEWKINNFRSLNTNLDKNILQTIIDTEEKERIADSLFARNNYLKAFDMYLKLADQFPFNANYYAKLGLTSAIISRKEKELWNRGVFEYMNFAEYAYEIALQLEPKNSIAHLAKGVNNLLIPGYFSNIDEAINQFIIVLSKDPYNYLANYYLVKAYKKKGFNKKSCEVKDKLKKLKRNELFK